MERPAPLKREESKAAMVLSTAFKSWLTRRAEASRDADRRRFGVKDADHWRKQSLWRPAAAGYRAYLNQRPGDFGIRSRLIKTLFASGDLASAKAAVQEAIERRPDKNELYQLARRIEDRLQSLHRQNATAEAGISAYQTWRSGLTIPAAPIGEVVHLTVIVDTRNRSPADLAATLQALSGLRNTLWTARILSDAKNARSLAETTRREPTANTSETAASGTPSNYVLRLSAGVVVEPEAVAWLAFALRQTGSVAAYGDHDRSTQTGTWREPAFHAVPHPADLATTPQLPVATLFRAQLGEAQDIELGGALLAAFSLGEVAHVPLLLATVRSAPDPEPTLALAAQITTATTSNPSLCAEGEYVSSHELATILVVIPTRDEAKALSVMLESLVRSASQPERVRFAIVDNGSVEPETSMLLRDWGQRDGVIVIRSDKPFNWSALNNLAVQGRAEDVLVFANNDMEMLTSGWDDILMDHLAKAETGAVGARLLYPEGHVQHAGIVLGGLEDIPVHDGLGVEETVGGPLDRWRRSRPAAALTGAFLGVRRKAFADVGGFDEKLAVSCNDIDFCLRLREAGLTVIYEPALTLTHHESRTRGHDDTADKLARTAAELAFVRNRWGDAFEIDPSRNPHWVGHETLLYFGFRCPSAEEVRGFVSTPSSRRWAAYRAG